jgi:hypothetical protein
MPNKKDYINNVYQPHSRYVAPIQYDPKLGAYYSERSNWLGGRTEDLSQAMSDYIFQSVNFR